MRGDQLLINGSVFRETFIDEEYAQQIRTATRPFTLDFGPLTLADDEIFLMGDNRPFSSDSRMFGPFKLDKILSKDVYIFFPFDQWIWLSGE